VIWKAIHTGHARVAPGTGAQGQPSRAGEAATALHYERWAATRIGRSTGCIALLLQGGLRSRETGTNEAVVEVKHLNYLGVNCSKKMWKKPWVPLGSRLKNDHWRVLHYVNVYKKPWVAVALRMANPGGNSHPHEFLLCEGERSINYRCIISL